MERYYVIMTSFTYMPSRDIYYAKYYGKGGGGKWPAGEKIKLGVGEKMKKG